MLSKTGLQNRRAQFAADAAKAMEEYLAEPEAVRVRTARLRALRLERDAAVAAAEQAKKVVAIKKKLMDVSQVSAKIETNDHTQALSSRPSTHRYCRVLARAKRWE
jgi:hypothetical protein